MGGIYEEQNKIHKAKKLIILHNFTSLETCDCIKEEMEDALTDIIIIINNEGHFKEEIQKEISKYFSRGCKIIEVKNLNRMIIMQRMLFGLLEKNNFVARDADRFVFKLLSNYSKGKATIVRMLISLTQKCSNGRNSFELVKQQFIQDLKESDSNPTNKEEYIPILLQNHCMFIKDVLKLSVPAYFLLNCLSILGPVCLPRFFIKQLENDISQKQTMHQPTLESLIEELEKNGVISKYPCPLVYHKDLNPNSCLDSSQQLMFIPTLICDAVKDEMGCNNRDALLYTQCALNRVLMENPDSPYIPLFEQLLDFCNKQLAE